MLPSVKNSFEVCINCFYQINNINPALIKLNTSSKKACFKDLHNSDLLRKCNRPMEIKSYNKLKTLSACLTVSNS